MKNIINYYYNLNLIDLFEIDNMYYFNYKNSDYFFLIFDRPIEDANSIFNTYLELKKRQIITNDIITNKNNQVLTIVNNIPYILIRDNTRNKCISINDILYIQNNTIGVINEKKMFRNDWVKMWESKIDYYEEQLSLINNKYKILDDTIDYYIGLGENAISYLVNNKVKTPNLCLSHRRIDINKGSFEFYNPVNYIIDSRVRDLSEFIKTSFFLDKINFDLIRYYIDYMNFSRDEYILLIARLLFPTYYFDLYDSILNSNMDENIVINVIDKTKNYLMIVKNIFFYILYQKRVSIPSIEWIIKETS